MKVGYIVVFRFHLCMPDLTGEVFVGVTFIPHLNLPSYASCSFKKLNGLFEQLRFNFALKGMW